MNSVRRAASRRIYLFFAAVVALAPVAPGAAGAATGFPPRAPSQAARQSGFWFHLAPAAESTADAVRYDCSYRRGARNAAFRLEFGDAEYAKGGVPLFFYRSAVLRVPGTDGSLLLEGLLRGIHAARPASAVRPADRFPFIAAVLRMKPSGKFAPRPWVDWSLMELDFRPNALLCYVNLQINAAAGEGRLWLDPTRTTAANLRCVADQFAAVFS